MITFISTWFFDGFTHPLETPSHLILLVGLAVLIGQQAERFFLRNLFLFCSSLLVGFILNNYFSLHWNNELILLVIALLVSLFVVLRLDFRSLWVQIITLVCSVGAGIMIGIDTSPIMIPGLGVNTVYNWLFGAAMGIYLTIIIIASLSKLLRNAWQGIILRVLGSWIATSALFVLTLLMVKQ